MKKLKEAVQYLAYLSGKKPHKLNKVKLTKLLWLFEGIIYIRTGKRSLGLRFMRNKYGFVSPDVDLVLINSWNEDKKQTKEQGNNEDKDLILRAIDIPEIHHLSTDEVVLLSLLHNLMFMKCKNLIYAMDNCPSLEVQKNFVGGNK